MRILFALMMFLASSAPAETVAIKVGAIVDPVSGTEARDQIILVDNGMIRDMGSGVAVPREARVIDLSAEWLAPGLMDAHQHLSLGMVYEARQPYPDVAVYLTESTAHRLAWNPQCPNHAQWRIHNHSRSGI